MRGYILIAIALTLVCTPRFAEPALDHKETEELMQYMEADKALSFVKQQFMFMAREMAKADIDESKLTKEDMAKQEDIFKKVEELIKKEITWEKVKDSFTAVFENVFTEAERADLLKFYRSPTGIAYRKKFPELSLKLLQAGQQLFMHILPVLENMRQEEMGKGAPEKKKN